MLSLVALLTKFNLETFDSASDVAVKMLLNLAVNRNHSKMLLDRKLFAAEDAKKVDQLLVETILRHLKCSTRPT